MSIRRQPTEQEIADRARELYEQHPHLGGDGQQDWAEAKAELEAAEAAAESAEVPAGMEETAATTVLPDAGRSGRR